jgi:signal transduction histidine kinase
VSGAWRRLGLRGRLALSIAAILLVAFALLLVTVQLQNDDEFSERVLPVVAVVTIAGALLASFLLAARTAAPLRRLAETAAAVDAGDLSPRSGGEPGAAVEVRLLAETLDGMLDRLDEAFTRQRRFVSDASHELRTPLTAVRGQIEVLARQENPDAAEVRRVEGVVLGELGRIEGLVDDLVALARLDERQEIRAEDVDLLPFLDGVAAIDPGWRVEVGAIPAGNLRADPRLLTRALVNLFANARRHAGPRGRVLLSAASAEGWATVAVDDDGPGIAAAEWTLVFDRFYRSDRARARDSGGSGLGLAIVREIALAHGGTAGVEDSPLGGARLWLRLPGFTAA